MGLTRNQTVMVAVLLAGTLLAVLNQTLLSPALPSIMADMGVSATTVQWLTSGYSLVEAVVIPLSAYLVGRFSTRQLYIGGIVIFTAGSLLASLAPSFGFLLVGRMLQAVCTGIVMPMVMTVVLLVFPREKRGMAMGIVGLLIGFAPAVGPSLSGLLVDSVGWRWLFGIVTGLAVLVLVLAAAFLRNYGEFKRTSFDALSVALSSVGLVCLLYGLSTFSSSSNIVLTSALIIAGLAALALFVKRQLTLDQPMLKVSILRTRAYATAVVVIVIIQAALMGTGVLLPLYIQGILGLSATASGVAMLPGAVLGAVLGLAAGRLFDRFGARRLVIPGGLVVLVGVLGMVAWGVDTSILFVGLSYTVLSIGMQFCITPLNTWGVNALPNDVIQHAQGTSNTLNQVAASLGTAVLVSVSALAAGMGNAQMDAVQKTMFGYHSAFCVTFALMAIAFVVMVLFVRDRKGAAGSEERAPKSLTRSHEANELDALTTRDAMNPDSPWVRDDATMGKVLAVLAETETSGLAVVDDERRIVGFVSDGDIASYMGKSDVSMFDAFLNLYYAPDDGALGDRLDSLEKLNVMQVATKHVITVDANCPLDEAIHVLSSKRIKKVPVVENGQLAGSLSRRDIVNALTARRSTAS